MPERIRVVGEGLVAVDDDLVIGGHRHRAAVVPSVADIVALEHKVVTRA